MSVSGISINLFSYTNQAITDTKPPIPNLQQVKQEFRQLGKDLQAGDLSAAQADFAELQQIGPPGLSNASSRSNNPWLRTFEQLSQDLQSGDLAAAQQDYAKIQQAFRRQAAQAENHNHQGASEIHQLLQQLGDALQSGDLSSAQQAFATLKQDLQQPAESFGEGSAASPSACSVSVTA